MCSRSIPLAVLLLISLVACDLAGENGENPTPLRVQVKGGVGGYVTVSSDLGHSANGAMVSDENLGSHNSAGAPALFLPTVSPDSSVIVWVRSGTQLSIRVEHDETGETIGAHSSTTAHRITVRVDGDDLSARSFSFGG